MSGNKYEYIRTLSDDEMVEDLSKYKIIEDLAGGEIVEILAEYKIIEDPNSLLVEGNWVIIRNGYNYSATDGKQLKWTYFIKVWE